LSSSLMKPSADRSDTLPVWPVLTLPDQTVKPGALRGSGLVGRISYDYCCI